MISSKTMCKVLGLRSDVVHCCNVCQKQMRVIEIVIIAIVNAINMPYSKRARERPLLDVHDCITHSTEWLSNVCVRDAKKVLLSQCTGLSKDYFRKVPQEQQLLLKLLLLLLLFQLLLVKLLQLLLRLLLLLLLLGLLERSMLITSTKAMGNSIV